VCHLELPKFQRSSKVISVDVSKPVLILVMGLPGSGKSYFATRLSETLKCAYISSDVVRIKKGYSSRYKVNEKFEVYSMMIALAEQELDRGGGVVVDATFYRKILRQSFSRLAARMHSEIRYIVVVAHQRLARQRLSQTRMYSEADFEVYKLLRAEFQEVDEPHLMLHSTDSNLAEMINIAVEYLRSFADVAR
jgi:predicted kinase